MRKSRPGYLGCGGDNNPNMLDHMCPKEQMAQAANGVPADNGDSGKEMSPQEVLFLVAVIDPEVYRQI